MVHIAVIFNVHGIKIAHSGIVIEVILMDSLDNDVSVSAIVALTKFPLQWSNGPRTYTLVSDAGLHNWIPWTLRTFHKETSYPNRKILCQLLKQRLDWSSLWAVNHNICKEIRAINLHVW